MKLLPKPRALATWLEGLQPEEEIQIYLSGQALRLRTGEHVVMVEPRRGQALSDDQVDLIIDRINEIATAMDPPLILSNAHDYYVKDDDTDELQLSRNTDTELLLGRRPNEVCVQLMVEPLVNDRAEE